MRKILILVLALVATVGAVGGGDATGAGEKKRSVALVVNGFEGTIDLIGLRSLKRIGTIDAAPDYRACLASAAPAGDTPPCVASNQLAEEDVVILLDDVRVSPDGRTAYVSRPSLGDVVAIDVATERLLWSVQITGSYPDHLALSPDGRRLLVSARGVDIVEVIDTRSASIVDSFPTGIRPHGNEFSADGERVYNGSLGLGAAPPGECGCWLTVVDAATMDVDRVIQLDQGIRPFVVMPGGRRAYLQLTYLPGLVEYSLREERVLRTLQLPVTEGSTTIPPGSDPRAVNHHGIALSPDRSKICAAASISDYVAIVRRRSLSVKATIPVGDEPAWATSTSDGRYCLVANRKGDSLSVISYRRPREVARIPVGDHPKRIQVARIPAVP